MTRVRLAGERTFRSLHVRNYRLFFFSQLISLTGTWMQSIAQSWLVYDLTHSPYWLGVVPLETGVHLYRFGIDGKFGPLGDVAG